MSELICSHCYKIITDENDIVKCSKCDNVYHIKCGHLIIDNCDDCGTEICDECMDYCNCCDRGLCYDCIDNNGYCIDDCCKWEDEGEEEE